MTGSSKIVWCLKAIILGAICIVSNANTLWIFYFVASALLFSVILPSDKEIFVLFSISESEKNKKYYKLTFIVTVSGNKQVSLLRHQTFLGRKILTSVCCPWYVIGTLSYFRALSYLLADSRKVNILMYFTFAIPHNMKYGRILWKQN